MTRVLLVSSYPPRHCGIGAYAHAQAARLREAGDEVTVLSPPDGEGDIRLGFFGGRPFVRAAREGDSFDRIVVHLQPALYFRPRAPLSKIGTALALRWLVARRPRTEILVHETDPEPPLWRPDHLLLRSTFRTARLLFHTDAERRELERRYRVRVRAALVRHVADVHAPGVDRAAARRRLGLPLDEPIFLCAGFIHPDKGIERAVEAWNRAGRPGRLAIVGSVKPTPENLAYAKRLRALVDGEPGVLLVERWVADDEFDAWIGAADRVVLPYVRSWSSGALARAQALGTPAIVAAVGGLAEQAGDGDVVVRTDDDLVRALAEPVGARR